jgi:hypothetical protein
MCKYKPKNECIDAKCMHKSTQGKAFETRISPGKQVIVEPEVEFASEVKKEKGYHIFISLYILYQ